MSWSLARMVLLTVAVLTLAACSGQGQEAGDGPAAPAQESTAPASQSTTTVATPALSPPLPTVDDPCVTGPPLSTGRTEYSFEFEGQDLPVGVDVATDAALDDPLIVVGLHAGGFPWTQGLQAWEPIWPQLGSKADNLIIFAPQADDTDTPWWTKTREFNVSYLTSFFDRLEDVVCLQSSPVLLTGFGQGTVAATQAYCADAIDVDLAAILLLIGMTKIEGCEPSEAVPLVTIDRFQYSQAIGPHWDGRWDMPRPIDLELTGGLAATPDDFAYWAKVYDCSGPSLTEEIPDPTGYLDRLTTVLSHRDCRADLVAIGLTKAPNDNRVFDIEALDQLLDLLEVEFARLLDDP